MAQIIIFTFQIQIIDFTNIFLLVEHKIRVKSIILHFIQCLPNNLSSLSSL